MPNRRPGSWARFWWVGTCSAGSLFILLLWVLPGQSASEKQNAHRLASMSSAERARVQRLAAEFRSMTPAQQQAMRELTATLAAAGAEEAGLRETARDYLRWRDTIPRSVRERIDAAPNDGERCALVRDALAEQRRQLAADLQPIRASAEMGRFEGNRLAQRERLAQLERTLTHLTDAERAWLDEQKPKDRLLGLLLLAGKYETPLPPALAEAQQQLYAGLYARLRNQLRGFEGGEYGSLPASSQRDFRRLLAALIPPANQGKLLAYLDRLDVDLAGELRSLEQIYPPLPWLIATLFYYRSHPEEQPARFREFARLLPTGPPQGLPWTRPVRPRGRGGKKMDKNRMVRPKSDA